MNDIKPNVGRIIIAGFPGVGKSFSGDHLQGIVLDLESSDFHWKIAPDGRKQEIYSWWSEYCNAANTLRTDTEGSTDIRYKNLKYICTSTHKEVLTWFRWNKVPFVTVVPNSKEEAIKRYRKRGNSEDFIKTIDTKYDTWMEAFSMYNMPIVRLAEGQYLSDILSLGSTYDYLANKISDAYKFILDPELDIDGRSNNMDYIELPWS